MSLQCEISLLHNLITTVKCIELSFVLGKIVYFLFHVFLRYDTQS